MFNDELANVVSCSLKLVELLKLKELLRLMEEHTSTSDANNNSSQTTSLLLHDVTDATSSHNDITDAASSHNDITDTTASDNYVTNAQGNANMSSSTYDAGSMQRRRRRRSISDTVHHGNEIEQEDEELTPEERDILTEIHQILGSLMGQPAEEDHQELHKTNNAASQSRRVKRDIRTTKDEELDVNVRDVKDRVSMVLHGANEEKSQHIGKHRGVLDKIGRLKQEVNSRDWLG